MKGIKSLTTGDPEIHGRNSYRKKRPKERNDPDKVRFRSNSPQVERG
jgi:hypothetical protein